MSKSLIITMPQVVLGMRPGCSMAATWHIVNWSIGHFSIQNCGCFVEYCKSPCFPAMQGAFKLKAPCIKSFNARSFCVQIQRRNQAGILLLDARDATASHLRTPENSPYKIAFCPRGLKGAGQEVAASCICTLEENNQLSRLPAGPFPFFQFLEFKYIKKKNFC